MGPSVFVAIKFMSLEPVAVWTLLDCCLLVIQKSKDSDTTRLYYLYVHAQKVEPARATNALQALHHLHKAAYGTKNFASETVSQQKRKEKKSGLGRNEGRKVLAQCAQCAYTCFTATG